MQTCAASLAGLISIAAVRLAAAAPAILEEPPVVMSPITVYGGDYRVLPGAASLNVLTSEPVQGGALATTRDLSALAPNFVTLDGNNNRMPRFSVRGLRENNFVTGDAVVGLYLDDVPYADLYSRSLALLDVESIEFIRGPQGTLYGASGPGGVLNITGHQPSNLWQGRARFTYGSYNQQAYDATLSGPIVTDQLAFGFSGLYSQRDGFVRNLLDGGRLDDQETLAGRVQLRWTPAEPWELSLYASAQCFNDGFVPTYLAGSDQDFFHVRRDFVGHVDTKSWNLAFKAAWHNDAVKVTSVTSYRDWRQDLAQDFDFSANALGATVGVFQPELRQWTEEVRVHSLDQDAPLKWNAGLYFAAADTETDSGRTIDVFFLDSSMTHAELEARTYAIFGEATYSVREKLDFVAGLRLTGDQRDMTRSRSGVDVLGGTGPFQTGPFSVDDTFGAVQPKLGLAYHFQPECMWYATASAGYQSGGFNVSNDAAAQSGFDPARSWHFETGVRTLWAEGRLELNAALFYTRTEDYQVYRLSLRDPTQAWLLNAARASSWGAETEVLVRPTKDLTLSLLAGYTTAEFDRFYDSQNNQSFDGNEINFVPEFTATLAAEYQIWKGLYARAEVVGVGKYYLDEANSAAQDAYALLNARVGYRYENFEIFAFGRNLSNEEYASNALDFRPFSDPVRQPGDPLCLGVGVSAEF